MKILVAGGAGYIGSHTCVTLLSAGHELVVVDNFANSEAGVLKKIEKISGVAPKFYKADVRDGGLLQKIFDEFKPEAVVHFAGLKVVGESRERPLRYYECNVGGSISLFNVMARNNVKTIVFSSTAAVYGNAKMLPVDETSPVDPLTPYGHGKAMIERMLADISAGDPSWRVAALRYFNPVGAHNSGLIGEHHGGTPSNLLPNIALVADGKLGELKVYGGDFQTPDGTGVRDYIHVVDLAEGHMAALNYLAKRHKGMVTINLGTGKGHSVLETVKVFERVSGKKIPYKIEARREGDIAESVASVSKAKELLGWQTKLGLEEMCRDLWRRQTLNSD
ncbi:MAG: UDP-glucose 4-epimerase GalE [Nitrospinae bacterium]|nr:UDP-glucose 4-epimerase GalE [Nitrospinota bacterium]